jgi:hypothetical protein
VKRAYRFVRRGPGLRHIVDESRGTHTVCGCSLEAPKPSRTPGVLTGVRWRLVGKDDKTKVCGSCDRMKDADTMQGRR